MMQQRLVTRSDPEPGVQLARLRVTIRGAVQGVGFRPSVYRLATSMGLAGWVSNTAQGVIIEIEGLCQKLDTFLLRLEAEKPPRSFIQSLETTLLDPVGYMTFEVRHSDESGAKTAIVLPDIATCPDCLSELHDPANRRYRYPFTNCTNCGPRFSIIKALPYDRASTTMRRFSMCAACQAEYDNPLDRRFQAQPNACPRCGPQLALWDSAGASLAERNAALRDAADAIRCGMIVAIKGLGGFQLLVDARDEAAVLRLRRHKLREEKPLALMFPTLGAVKAECAVSALEERLLFSPEAPIVLLRRAFASDSYFTEIAPAVALANPYLGAMLPYTPLHHLLMDDLGFPVVATSGNLSDEPICTDEREALERLQGIADLFLMHDRPIARHVDDSVARVVLGREMVLRRARGYAPLPIRLAANRPAGATLAVGAHVKNTVALSVGDQVFISQHIGDLDTAPAYDAFKRVVTSLSSLYDVTPVAIAHDLHPDYASTQYAVRRMQSGTANCILHAADCRLVPVQHHYAHILACMAENELDSPVLGVAWDGTGCGTDGTVWGGEFLRITEHSFERAAHLRTFRLPGGEQAIREPRRAALGLLYELFGDALFCMEGLAPLHACSEQERAIFRTMLTRDLNSPLTSSIGRLFDAIAAIIGLRQQTRFEGQAAMELEWAIDGFATDACYPFRLVDRSPAAIVDWQPMLRTILEDVQRQVPVGLIATMFHNTLAEMIVAVARRVGEGRVVLSGGCFQNAYLTERTVQRLHAAGFRVYWHQRIPPNDGGIALGQIAAVARSAPSDQPHMVDGLSR